MMKVQQDLVERFLAAAEVIPFDAWTVVIERQSASKNALSDAEERLSDIEVELIRETVAKKRTAEEKQAQKNVITAQNARINALAMATGARAGKQREEEVRKAVKLSLIRARSTLSLYPHLKKSADTQQLAALMLDPFAGIIDLSGL